MTIFIPYEGNKSCAAVLDDLRIPKAIEDALTILNQDPWKANPFDDPPLPAQTQRWAIWANDNKHNYLWLLKYYEHCMTEYFKRYQKFHPLEDQLVHAEHKLRRVRFGRQTPFVNTTIFQNLQVHEANRLQLTMLWDNDKPFPTWYGKEKRPW